MGVFLVPVFDKSILYHVAKEEPTQEQVFAVEFFCIGITIKIHKWIKLNVPYPSKTLCDMIFLSMPKEIEDIINQYYVSKKELILVTESLR